MKKTLFTFLLVFLPMLANADGVEINGIYYNLVDKAKIAEVTYGNWEPYTSESGDGRYSGEIVIPESVTYEETNYSVTSIRDNAFYGCSDLTSVTIGNSVTTIGYAAFKLCSSLTSITIPNSVTTIGDEVFSWCSGLTSITIPNSVTTIGDEAFSRCSGLTSVTIPNSVTTIGESAFYYCSGLTSVTIPNSVTTIGNNAFRNCRDLTSVTISNSVTTIGNNAFEDCSGLTSVTIPNSVTTIGDEAFSWCSGLTSVTIPNSVTSIGGGAFNFCSGLTSIEIPNSVISIGGWAFQGCSGLTSIEIPNSLTSIDENAFFYCSGLTSVTIPNSVTTISNSAFSGCTGLTDVYCKAESVPYTETNAFENSYPENITLHVPAGSLDAYKAVEPWSLFKEILPIEDIPSDEDVITIKDAGKGTWCSEYDLDFTDVEGIKAYTATGYDNDSKIIWLSRVLRVPAKTGIMVKGDPGDYKIPHASVKAVYANFFVGNLGSKITIEATDGDMTNYYMKNGTFVSVNGTASISPNRCYLQLPTSVFAGTRSVELIYDDEETTGIMDNGQWIIDKDSDAWYNINGQRISQPTKKGLYIHNGLKVVIR